MLYKDKEHGDEPICEYCLLTGGGLKEAQASYERIEGRECSNGRGDCDCWSCQEMDDNNAEAEEA